MSLPSASARPPARRNSISEVVAERIRVYVLTEGLQPGDRSAGRRISPATSASAARRSARRYALLSSEHLIRASKGPGGGIFVAATPEEGIGLSVSATVASMLDAHSIEIDELLETRMLLEIPLAGLAAQRARDEDLAALGALLARGRTAAEHAPTDVDNSMPRSTGSSRRSPTTASRARSQAGSSMCWRHGCTR